MNLNSSDGNDFLTDRKRALNRAFFESFFIYTVVRFWLSYFEINIMGLNQ